MKASIDIKKLNLEVIDRQHPLWEQAVSQIQERYRQAFDARLCSYMPIFTALMQSEHIISLCGYRIAEGETLFLEQYLAKPADVILSETFDTYVLRKSLVEFGQLGSFTKGISYIHFLKMTETLVEQGMEWCIFTATDPLYALMKRLGLSPVVIADADPDKIPHAPEIWGTYYQYQPRVFAGNLKHGLELLSSRLQSPEYSDSRKQI
ncbi:delta-VPH [Vibrio sp. HA2012]|uniref:thermostable hemolysin n=1 Tax=Vibrio sp. HA2012 TaxID=1971595 RepID=UPI000C2C2217|nr:thermostable hemolysin [Vibrio sp. HA2012]PJC86030.1 delta-VPH [Vibrio sp. HA2012]